MRLVRCSHFDGLATESDCSLIQVGKDGQAVLNFSRRQKEIHKPPATRRMACITIWHPCLSADQQQNFEPALGYLVSAPLLRADEALP